MSSPEILFVGNFARHARSAHLASALADTGARLIRVDSEVLDENGDRIYFDDALFRVLRRVGFPPDRQGVNRAALDALDAHRPDVVWVSKALSLRPEVLRRARQVNPDVKLVFHSEDDMYARHNQSSWFRKTLPLYDVVFTHKSYNADAAELPSLGARRVVMIDKCYDRELHRPIEVTDADRARLGAPVGFVGTYERERAESLLELARAGFEVRVWGGLWEGFRGTHPNLTVEKQQLRGDDYVRALCATDVNLGFLRKQNRDLQTDRSIEIPACGAFMLAERTHEHEALFTEGVEAEYFGDPEELVRKVRHYLDHADERRSIAAAGRERCLASGYSFHERARVMLDLALETRVAA